MKKVLKFLRFFVDIILLAIVLFVLITYFGKWQKKLFFQAYKEALNSGYLTEQIIEGKRIIREI